MKLYYTDRSPYARKVRVVAQYHGMAMELVAVELRPQPPELLLINPLGKVPALALDDGTLIADSPVIAVFLDGIGTAAPLLPADSLARARVSTLEAICDGILDAAVAVVYEHILREEQDRSQVILAKHAATIARGVNWLARHPMQLEGPLTLGSLAAAVTLDYLRHRMPDFGIDQFWVGDQPPMLEWLDRTLTLPAFAGTAPKQWSY